MGRAAAGDGDEAGAALRVAAAQGAGRGRRRRADRHARARLRAAARPGRRRRHALRAARRRRAAARGARACGAARRSTTSPTSRSPPPRSAASRSCGWRRSSWRSSATSTPAATARWSASSRRWCSRSRCASGCTRSGCWRCTAAAARPTRSRPTGRPGARSSSAIGVEPGPELRRLHEAILRQDPSLEPPAIEPLELPPELDAGTPLVGREAELERLREHWRRARGGAGRLVLVDGRARDRQDAAGGRARRRGAPRRRRVLYASARVDAGGDRGAGGRSGARRCWCSTTSTAPARRSASCVDESATLPVLVLATAEDAAFATALGAADDADPGAARRRRRAAPWRGCTRARARTRRSRSSGSRRRAAACRSGCTAPRASGRAAAAVAAPGRRREPHRGRAPGLRAAEDDLAGGVVELQAARERAELARRDADAVVVCPFKGLASFDVEDADVLLRPRAARRRDGRAAGRCAADRHRRAVGQRQVLGAAGRPARRARRRRAARAASAGRSRCCGPASTRCAALEQAIADGRARGRLVVAVDQFEEVFTACRDEDERAAFVDALVACARDPRRRALVLVAVRADFYGRCASYPELSRLLGANHVLVGPMRRDELRRAIELPARRAGLRGRARARRRADRRRRGRARRAAAAVDRAARAVAAARRPAPAPQRLRAGRRRARRGRAAGRARVRAARPRAAARSRAGSCCGSRARARATPSCAGACRSPSSRARASPRSCRCWPTTAWSRSARARSRSRTRRCCASGRACAAGSRRTPRAAACTST